jgi:hypothetical protein
MGSYGITATPASMARQRLSRFPTPLVSGTLPGHPAFTRGVISPPAASSPPILADLSLQTGTLTVQSGGFDPSQMDYRPPTFAPTAPASRYPTPLVSGTLPAPSFTLDASRLIPTPRYPTPLVSTTPRYAAPRRSFWDFFRPAPRRLPYPTPRRGPRSYLPLVPGGELYAAGVFGPGIDAVPEMPAADTATASLPAPSAATSPWLLIGGLAVAGFVAYRYLGKRRAVPGVA